MLRMNYYIFLKYNVMKKFTLLKIVCAIAILFSTTKSYSQLFQMTDVTNVNDICSSSGCTANSIEILGAYIGNGSDGSMIDDCSDIIDPNNVWVIIDVSRNGKKHDLFTQFYITDFVSGNVELFQGTYETTQQDGIQTGKYKAKQVLNYCTGGQPTALFELTDILVSWDTSASGAAGCGGPSYSQCDGSIADIIVQGPFIAEAISTNAACFGDDGSVHVIASGGTQPYEISIDNAPFVAFDGDEVYSLSTGSHPIIVRDANGTTSNFIEEVLAGTQITASQVTVQPDCNTLGSITASASGGIEPYLYVLFKDGNPTAEAFNETGVFNNLSTGSYVVNIQEIQDPPAVNCSTSLGPIILATIPDTEPPTLVDCPSNISVNTSDDGTGNCEVVVNYTPPTFNDNCDGTGTATLISGPASGDSLSVTNSPYTVVYS